MTSQVDRLRLFAEKGPIHPSPLLNRTVPEGPLAHLYIQPKT
jgi:hypothetical protein